MSVPTLTPASKISAITLPATGTLSHSDPANTNEVFQSVTYGIYSDPSAELYDANFVTGAIDQVSYVYKKLGGDILDLELTTGSVYNSYEESTLEYSYIINLHQATNALPRSLGDQTGSFDDKGNLSGSAITSTSLKYPKFSFDYIRRAGMGSSAEVGTMGSVEYSGSFDIKVGQQDYDLQSIFEAVTSPSASAKLTFDTANNLPGNNEKFTLIDASGKKLEFAFNTGADQNKEGVVDINGDGTGPAVAVSTVAAINAATTIGITAKINESDTNVVDLTQDTGGSTGNTTITEAVANMTATSFTEGSDITPYAGKIKGKKILVKQVFYKTPHAMWRFYGYYGGLNVVGNLHNYGQFTDDATFQLVPVWENKAQAMAFEDAIYTRMSHFSYEIKNNSQLRIYPIPQNFSPSKMWVRFSILDDDSDSDPITDGVNNLNTLPFGNLPYKNINSIGKQWIRRFSLALCKETLGQVRSKFGSVPIPGSDLKLNGAELITQSKEEQKALREELQNTLKELTYTKIAESEASMTENVNKALDKTPSMGSIFVG